MVIMNRRATESKTRLQLNIDGGKKQESHSNSSEVIQKANIPCTRILSYGFMRARLKTYEVPANVAVPVESELKIRVNNQQEREASKNSARGRE